MRSSLSALACALFMSTPALADEPARKEAAADTSFTVGEIVVTANRMAGSTDNVLTSVDWLGCGPACKRDPVSGVIGD